MLEISNGLSNSKLSQANAFASDVLSGKTFYAGDKTLKTGSMVNRGAWTASVSDGGFVTIPAGYHNGSGKVTGSSAVSGMTRLARAPVYDLISVELKQTFTGAPTYKCFIMTIGGFSWDIQPSISISGASYTLIDTITQAGYSGGQKFTDYFGWIYLVYNLSSSVTFNIYHEPGWGNRDITVYGIT